jgi:acyl-coenzyme A thioesterase PaaI-like protein
MLIPLSRHTLTLALLVVISSCSQLSQPSPTNTFASNPTLLHPFAVGPLYEAESGTLTDGARVQSTSNASGGQVVGALNTVGAALSLSSIDGGSGGQVNLRLRYANGYSTTRSLSLYVNGVKARQLSFAQTGSWNSFAETPSFTVELNAGSNTLKIQRDSSDEPAADIDWVEVKPSGPQRLEAESATLTNGARVQSTSNASGGQVVGALNTVGAALSLSSINGGSGGQVSLRLRYANGYSTTRSLSVYLNGARVGGLSFASTGSWNSFADSAALALTLNAGSTNTIKVQRDGSDVAAADIDYLMLEASQPDPTPVPPVPVISPQITPLRQRINVAVGQSIAAAAQSAQSGDQIVVAAGTFDEQPFELKTGVSLIGAGRSATTIRFRTFNTWQGSIRLRSETTTIGGQEIAGLTLDGQNAQAFMGVEIQNRTDIRIRDVKVIGFFHAGIQIVGGRNQRSANLELADFWIGETSREEPNSLGNLMTGGNVDRLLVRNGVFETLSDQQIGPTDWNSTRSGYGIKVRPAYEGSTEVPNAVLSNSRIVDNQFRCKPNARWNNGGAPNISLEVTKVSADNVEIARNTFDCHVSLEYTLNNDVVRTFWVHDNTFKVAKGQSIELAVPNVLVEKNLFDLRNNSNPWNVIGEYNRGYQVSRRLLGQRIVENTFELGSSTPSIFVYTTPIENWRFERNIVRGTGRPTLIELRGPTSNSSSNLTIAGNTFGSQGFQDFAYTEGSNGQRPINTVITP